MSTILKMTMRSLFTGLCVIFLTNLLAAQTAFGVDERLRKATTDQEKQEIAYKFARAIATSNSVQAAQYAQQAVELAVKIGDKRKEAESAWFGAELAERAGRLPAAVSLYAQAKTAAESADILYLPIRAAEKLQTITYKQGNYKAAYHWQKEYTRLLEEKYRMQISGENVLHGTERIEWTQQKDREICILLAILSAIILLLLLFFYNRRRADRRMRGELAEKNAMIEEKRRRSEQLLLNILPSAVAAELTVRNKVAARRYERTTVMFIDFVSFTQMAERLSPEELIAELDQCFSAFDELISRKRIEKIKTVGDAYICASGLSDRNESPSEIIKVALKIQQYLQNLREKREREGKPYFEARIGIHFGPVVAGIVGTKKFAYDIWGDTVNTAARMEQACLPGFVNVSGAARAVVEDEFLWEYRGKIAAKNKGELEMYYVTAR